MPENVPQPTLSSEKSNKKNIILIPSIVFLLVFGIVCLQLLDFGFKEYKFVEEGTIESIKNSLFKDVVPHTHFLIILVGYLFMSLFASCLIVFTKIRRVSKIVLGGLILIMVLTLYGNYSDIQKEANNYSSLLDFGKYPKVSRYEFERFGYVLLNGQRINFTVNDDIDSVLDYYKTNVVADLNSDDFFNSATFSDVSWEGNSGTATMKINNEDIIILHTKKNSNNTNVTLSQILNPSSAWDTVDDL